MNPLLLALSLSVTPTNAVIRCVTPGAGSYSVQCSADLHNWRVLASGYVSGAAHVVAQDKAGGQCSFYRVEWREKGK